MTIAEVTRAHHEDFNRALISNDLAKVSQVYANDYVLVRPDGSMFSKDQILAVLTGDNEAVTLRDGNERKSRFVAIYVKQEERIELVHFQSNNLPGAAVG